MLEFMGPEQQLAKVAQFDKEIEYAEKSQTHLWIAVQTHVITAKALKERGADPLLMDHETLRQVPIGCYVCEEPYEPRMLTRKCNGQPR